jgi:hypothetical protein
MENSVIQFEVGKTYVMSWIGDSDLKTKYTVVSRTEKTVILKGHNERDSKRFRCSFYRGVEQVSPSGKYSMSPILSADSPLKVEPESKEAEPDDDFNDCVKCGGIGLMGNAWDYSLETCDACDGEGLKAEGQTITSEMFVSTTLLPAEIVLPHSELLEQRDELLKALKKLTEYTKSELDGSDFEYVMNLTGSALAITKAES